MKLYKEAMRKLGLVGIAFLVVSVILTAIFCVSGANSVLRIGRIDTVFDLLPTLTVFAYAGGLAFAYVGFSFLNKRSDSDFYHSLPVRRIDLYIANTLAALTWTVATVVLSALASLVVYLFTAAPFIPQYYPLGALFFIVATMLVYAAAAIAVSVTGTFFTNIVMTGIVLFLPRFILFMIGRSIVAGVNIVGWWDLMGLLNPRTNVATGLVVMMRRSFLRTDFVTLPNILYSLVLTLVELALGGWLFVKRPSELAERGAKNTKLQTLFACLLTLPVLLIAMRYILDVRKLTIAILVVASLAVFVAYQLISLRNVKRVAKTLPWYLCTVALAFATFFGVRFANTAIRDVAPAASDIKSVQFGAPEPEYGDPNFNSLLVADIVFDNDEVKECVSTYLGLAVERLQTAATGEYYTPNRTFEAGVDNSIIPVKITLNNGRVIRRTFEFSNMNLLNEARNHNDAYAAAIRSFPTEREACFVSAQGLTGIEMSKADARKLMDSYFAERSGLDAIANEYFALQDAQKYVGRRRYNLTDEEQSYGNFQVSGYQGTHRYYQYYNIALDMPKTASLWMQLCNQQGGLAYVTKARQEMEALQAGKENNSNGSINFIATNVPMQDGTKQQLNFGYSEYYYEGMEENRDVGADYVYDMLDVMARGTLTSDPNAFNLCMTAWFYYNDATDAQREPSPQIYLAFTPEDETKLFTLMSEWNAAQAERQRIYDPDYVLPEIEAVAE